ncbi:MAG: DUF1631 domain-containing protein [Gammaproteobacteria bacterium]|nr:DUF1631 domain-containing protein [Gammaproteobacteria bacterium]
MTSGQTGSVEQDRTIIDGCRQAVSRGLGMLSEKLFDELDDTLYKLADKAESNDLQTHYFDTMRETRKERKGIERSFQENLLSGYDNFWRPQSRPVTAPEEEEVDYDALTLIESDILEEDLAISNMVARGESLCLGELYAMEQRFSKLLNGMPVKSKSNPLAPNKICTAFRTSVKVLEIDIPTKLVVYKMFEQEVILHLDEVYAGVNELMRDAGIIPKLRPKVRRSKVTAATSGRLASGRQGEALPQGADEATEELFDSLRQLLSGVQRGSSGGMVFRPGQPRADTSQVIDALSVLQQSDAASRSFDADMGNVGYVDLKSNLLQELRRVARNPEIGSVKQIDDDTIDMVSMLFEYILGDPNIPDVMKVLLAQLQIPVIKVAILDKEFFSKSSHPARRLLNDLAHVVVGWSGDKDQSKNSLYSKVDSIVRRILTDFREDVGLYAELCEELEEFISKEQRGSEVVEKRTNQVARGKEQLGVAKRRVKAEIDRRIKREAHLPLAVVNLLNEGWKDVLMLHFLQRGAKSKEWQGALALMDRLIGTVESQGDVQKREKMLREIPAVLGVMRQEMGGILCDQHMMSRLFGDLKKVHLSCLQGRDIPKELIVDTAALQDDVPEDVEEDKDKDSTVSVDPIPVGEAEKYRDLADSISLGSWLEIKGKDGVKSRVKLSWRSSVSNYYLFVDRRGVKAMEMKQGELALALRVGSAFVIVGAENSLMDRAFAAMMTSLKGTGNSTPEPA